MRALTAKGRFGVALVLGAAISFAVVAPGAVAKEERDRDRHTFYGWVETMPDDVQGTWIIGGRHIVTNPRTEFDQREGPLVVGGCAKVDIRGSAVHEIDSQPDGDCR
jgi:hypothetical protein